MTTNTKKVIFKFITDELKSIFSIYICSACIKIILKSKKNCRDSYISIH